MERIGGEEYIPAQRPSFPDVSDDDYSFKPKPLKPIPPIQRHEFSRRYYFCRRGGKPHQHYLKFIPCRKACSRYTGLSGALDRLPKRNRRLDVAAQDREFFWGLLAVEQVSAFRVFIYHLVILLGPFIFWWLWLFALGQSGDLQNASVPFSGVCVLLSMVWFPVLQGRKEN
jgi:hypothetical protein